MRIIGGHDYYDSAMAFGHDEHVVFVREKARTLPLARTQPVGLDIDDFQADFENIETGRRLFGRIRDQLSHEGQDYHLLPMAVVVGAKKYNGLRIIRRRSHQNIAGETLHFWSLAPLVEWLAHIGLRPLEPKWTWQYGRKSSPKLSAYFGVQALPQTAVNFLVSERITLLTGIRKDWYGRSEQPEWRVNTAGLKDLEFYRVLDAFTLFQEIEMWLGGVLSSSGNAMVELTDKVRLAKHGFDESSFRKPKQQS